MSDLPKEINKLTLEIKKLQKEVKELTQIRQLLLAETVRLRRFIEYLEENKRREI